MEHDQLSGGQFLHQEHYVQWRKSRYWLRALYNYTTDELYVGDDNGVLHKFTGVFVGTPAEVTTGWPITVNTGAILTGPVLDTVSHNIFVADHNGRLSFVKEVGSTTGSCASGSAPCLGSVSQSLTGSIVDPPVVDSATGRLLVVDGTETSGNNGSMFQFDTALTAGSKVTVKIGGNLSDTTDVLHSGAFDDGYISTGPASGHFYVCGKDSGFNNRPAIYQFAFNASGVLQTTGIPAPLGNMTSSFSLIGDACSPVTELKNGATDRIFFGFAINANPPSAGGTATGCTTGQGCVAMVTLGGTWPPAATTAGIPVPFVITGGTGSHAGIGGPSGIVVDNVGSRSSGIQPVLHVSSKFDGDRDVQRDQRSGLRCEGHAVRAAMISRAVHHPLDGTRNRADREGGKVPCGLRGRLAKMNNAKKDHGLYLAGGCTGSPKPVSERVFEVQALACGKVFATQGSCRFSRKSS